MLSGFTGVVKDAHGRWLATVGIEEGANLVVPQFTIQWPAAVIEQAAKSGFSFLLTTSRLNELRVHLVQR